MTSEEKQAYVDNLIAERKERKRERVRNWHHNNREYLRDRDRKRYATDPEKYRARQREYNASDWGKAVRRSRHLFARYGITQEDADVIFEAQGRRCGNPGCRSITSGGRRHWHVDHCHKTGRVRGILCHHCNVALGQAQENINRLLGLVDYLRQHPDPEVTPEGKE